MNIWQKFLEKWKSWVAELGEFSYKKWGTIWVVGALVAGGRLVSAFFGWPFALLVPLFLIFFAFLLRKEYKKKNNL